MSTIFYVVYNNHINQNIKYYCKWSNFIAYLPMTGEKHTNEWIQEKMLNWSHCLKFSILTYFPFTLFE